MKIGIALLAVLALAGCVSSGTKVTPDQVAAFTKGKTTMAEIVAKLGKPNSTANLSDGQTIIVYSYVTASPNAVSYVPVAGLLAGGATGTSESATFTFNANGVLTATSSSQSNTDVRTGLLNQH